MTLNYKPISLTALLIGKILDNISDQVVHLLEDNDIIFFAQDGFRNIRSCLTSLLDFFHRIYENWDNRIPRHVFYLDLKHHTKRLKRLAEGLAANLTSCGSCWLSGKQQKSLFIGQASEWLTVTIVVAHVIAATHSYHINDSETTKSRPVEVCWRYQRGWNGPHKWQLRNHPKKRPDYVIVWKE